MKKDPKNTHIRERRPGPEINGAHKRPRKDLRRCSNKCPWACSSLRGPSGRISYSNPAVAKIFGKGFQEKTESFKDYPKWMGHDLEGNKLKPEDYPGARSLLHAQTVSNQLIKFLREDGTWLWVRTSSAPLRDGEGKIIAAVVMTIDVSDEIEMQLTRRGRTDQAEGRARIVACRCGHNRRERQGLAAQ